MAAVFGGVESYFNESDDLLLSAELKVRKMMAAN